MFRALAQLPVEQRRLLVAVDVAGLDLSVAVDQLDLTPESAETLLRRARGTLAVALSGEGSRLHATLRRGP